MVKKYSSSNILVTGYRRKQERMDEIMTNLVGLEIKEFDNRCNEEIGLRIQNKRIERNMTGVELGTYLSVNANQVSRIETGKVKCKLEYIFILCQIFECSADYLLFGTEERDYLSDKQMKCIMDIKKYF